MSLTSYWPDDDTRSPLAAWEVERGNVFLLQNSAVFWYYGTHWGWWEKPVLRVLAPPCTHGPIWEASDRRISSCGRKQMILECAWCLLENVTFLKFSFWLWPSQETELCQWAHLFQYNPETVISVVTTVVTIYWAPSMCLLIEQVTL